MRRRRSPHEREHDGSADDRPVHERGSRDSTALDRATHIDLALGEPSTVPCGLSWFRPFYVACIVALSAVSLRQTRGPHDHHAWLAALEIVGALLLLVLQTRRAGLVLLLFVYGVATALTVQNGQVPFHLVLYAGTAIFLAQFRSNPPPFRDSDGRYRSQGAAQE